ncbi:hypothetical protein V2G26_013831 [Clonostachys chloroleuca]
METSRNSRATETLETGTQRFFFPIFLIQHGTTSEFGVEGCIIPTPTQILLLWGMKNRGSRKAKFHHYQQPFRTAVQNSRNRKWERSQRSSTTSCKSRLSAKGNISSSGECSKFRGRKLYIPLRFMGPPRD